MQKGPENRHMYSYFFECENSKQYSSISSLLPNHRPDMFYLCCRLVFSNQPICCIFRYIEKANAHIKIGVKKRRTLQLIYSSESFRKYRISHNHAMPQVMPHAIPPFTLTAKICLITVFDAILTSRQTGLK